MTGRLQSANAAGCVRSLTPARRGAGRRACAPRQHVERLCQLRQREMSRNGTQGQGSRHRRLLTGRPPRCGWPSTTSSTRCVLTDIRDGWAEGLAARPERGAPDRGLRDHGDRARPPVASGEGYEVIAGSSIVVITAGLPAQAGHEPDGPDRDQRQDRPPGGGERRPKHAPTGRDHRRFQPARRDDRAGGARSPASRLAACSARRACWTRPASPSSWRRSSGCPSARSGR